MVLLDHLWDDVVAGPQPGRGLKHLKKVYTSPNDGGEGSGIVYQRSLSMPSSPLTPGTPTNMSPTAGKKDNVWRSCWNILICVFNPGSNSATKNVGADYFDKPQPNSPTVYDWLYSGDTRSKHR
ncbi:dormancy-associated protein 1-like [Salvia splendens]|uniref:dormancy-associated protein 1-like n=1 Tax=Salvia splendens TaxID=180675 RepID=UPI001C262B53|nr:dormancy-associated protein 1-like [Salvia splendens]